MGILDFLFGEQNRKELTETEKYVKAAIFYFERGIDGDETYRPLYNAWCSFRSNPSQLKDIQNYGLFGTGLMTLLSYGTISDIDDQQQLASLAYLFLSKAIKKKPSDINSYKNRVLNMILNHDAFEYTVSSVINSGHVNLSIGSYSLDARDAMYMMEYADISSKRDLLNIDIISNHYYELNSKMSSGFFGYGESRSSVISSGKRFHNEVLEYLENKVIVNCDINI